jgi:uncharacterized protein YlaI
MSCTYLLVPCLCLFMMINAKLKNKDIWFYAWREIEHRSTSKQWVQYSRFWSNPWKQNKE